MYSILPAAISCVFIVYGVYVFSSKGVNSVTTSFFLICSTTFFWQCAWAILFQIDDPLLADQVIKLGWMLILCLPTTLYHFLVEITGKHSERKFVYASYSIALFLCALLLSSNLIISGHYTYFWGYYPKAGPFHYLHVIQTFMVVNRGLYITYKKQRISYAEEKSKLTYCIFGLFVYFLAATDYLCNYGFEMYPLGSIFVAFGLGIIAFATIKYHLFDDARLIAASIAHELRTPLATIKLYASILYDNLPALIEGYRLATEKGLVKKNVSEKSLGNMLEAVENIIVETNTSNEAIDMMLALTSDQHINEKDFKLFSAKECVEKAVGHYPYKNEKEMLIETQIASDFLILGSNIFLTYVLFNLIGNSLAAIEDLPDGKIQIHIHGNQIDVRDNGTGILREDLPHIFDNFYTTKDKNSNAGVGLSFCRKVMKSFGGDIQCTSSKKGQTVFRLSFIKINEQNFPA